jgi:hypothetical protein
MSSESIEMGMYEIELEIESEYGGELPEFDEENERVKEGPPPEVEFPGPKAESEMVKD